MLEEKSSEISMSVSNASNLGRLRDRVEMAETAIMELLATWAKLDLLEQVELRDQLGRREIRELTLQLHRSPLLK